MSVPTPVLARSNMLRCRQLALGPGALFTLKLSSLWSVPIIDLQVVCGHTLLEPSFLLSSPSPYVPVLGEEFFRGPSSRPRCSTSAGSPWLYFNHLFGGYS